MIIRPYTKNDTAALVGILRLNTPQYFDPSEEEEFVLYLAKKKEAYFVVLQEGQIIGSGGINYFPEERLARISWDMIHPHYQGKGVGKELMQHRIAEIRQHPNIEQIVVRTSQFVYPFYQKMGFVLEKTEKDFWAKGFDLYQMRLELN